MCSSSLKSLLLPLPFLPNPPHTKYSLEFAHPLLRTISASHSGSAQGGRSSLSLRTSSSNYPHPTKPGSSARPCTGSWQRETAGVEVVERVEWQDGLLTGSGGIYATEGAIIRHPHPIILHPTTHLVRIIPSLLPRTNPSQCKGHSGL